MRVKGIIGGLAVLGLLVPGATAAEADVVTEWNGHATQALNAPPQVMTPHLAMVHGAVYDAVNAIDGRREGYLVPAGSAPAGASVDAAAVAAAHGVLEQLVPAQEAALDAKRDASLAAIPDGPAKAGGITAGEQAAAAMLAERALDGRFGSYRFPGDGLAPGVWRPLSSAPTANDPNAWIKELDPFLIEDPSAFRSHGPVDLTTRQYAREFAEVKAYGSVNSTVRDVDQTRAARYWSENPAQTWSRVFRMLSAQEGLSVAENARMYAMLYMTATDALIAVWDDKAHWLWWRPVTAIQQAANDGNPQTAPQADWQSLIGAPPYPEHPSGHSGYSGSIVKTLQHVFGTDDIGWTDTNPVNQVKRSFSSFSQAIEEIVDARVWSGIHFRTADEQGHKIGRQVTAYLQGRFFGPSHGAK